MKTRLAAMAALLAVSLVTAGEARAQNPQTRDGFWFNLGLGAGSLGCSDCGARESGPSGGIALGGTLNKQWLLGVFSNAWTKSVDGLTLTVGTVVAGVRFYPSESSGFFFLGGLGLGRLDVAAGGESAGENGSGALLGLGWDIRVASNVSLTPFWNGAAVKVSGGDANFGQIGIGFTIH